MKITELTSAPTVGEFYMVPTVHYHWAGRYFDWPVILPLHFDPDLNFDVPHWNVDVRFTDAAIHEHCRTYALGPMRMAEHYAQLGLEGEAIGIDCAAIVALIYGPPGGVLPTRPTWKRLRCERSEYVRAYRCPVITEKVQSQFPDPALPAIRHGRMFCPHKGADLTGVAPDADGFVRCPLHQLRVFVGIKSLRAGDSGAAEDTQTQLVHKQAGKPEHG